MGVGLEQEDDAAGFLGVRMERDEKTGLIEMKQTGLIADWPHRSRARSDEPGIGQRQVDVSRGSASRQRC